MKCNEAYSALAIFRLKSSPTSFHLIIPNFKFSNTTTKFWFRVIKAGWYMYIEQKHTNLECVQIGQQWKCRNSRNRKP